MKALAQEEASTQKRIDYISEQYRMPFFKLKELYQRKDIRFVHAVAEVKGALDGIHLEGLMNIANSPFGAPVVKQVIGEKVKELLTKKFAEPIKKVDFLLLKRNDQFHMYCITSFTNNIFASQDQNLGIIEDRTAGNFSRAMKKFTGIGPKRCKALILQEKQVLLCVEGFFSSGQRKLALEEKTQEEYITSIAQKQMLQIAGDAFSSFGLESCIPFINIKENEVSTIIYLKNCQLQ